MIVVRNGLQLAAKEWPGSGLPTVLMAHATGFCKEVWTPVIDELRALGCQVPISAWDQRSHGASGRSALPIDWWETAEDALAVADRVGKPVVGVGHSSGAAALLMGEILRPRTFERIVAIEPVVFPPPYGPGDDHPLTLSAQQRRSRYSSLAEARANFAAKEVFAAWDGRALDGYVAGGLVEINGEWELACPPEHEASFYAGAGNHQAWERLGEIGIQVVMVSGEQSQSHPPESTAALEARFQSVETVVVKGAGHFVPMEYPARTAAIIDQAITASMTSS